MKYGQYGASEPLVGICRSSWKPQDPEALRGFHRKGMSGDKATARTPLTSVKEPPKLVLFFT